nr:hypothetical protein [Halomonas populi]
MTREIPEQARSPQVRRGITAGELYGSADAQPVLHGSEEYLAVGQNYGARHEPGAARELRMIAALTFERKMQVYWLEQLASFCACCDDDAGKILVASG